MFDEGPASAEATGECIEPAVPELLQQATSQWWQSETYTPPLGRAYGVAEQREIEMTLMGLRERILSELKTPPRSKEELAALQGRTLPNVVAIAKSALDLSDEHLNILMALGFVPAAIAFAREARRFDPQVSGEDIAQASRNALTMYCLQALLGLPVRLTPSIFAYSMIYPYSDNYLDDPHVAASAKLVFSEHFRCRISGQAGAAANRREQVIFDLLGMIESEYERQRYPQVYASLLAIHEAQSKSLWLNRATASPYEVDVLAISMEKGGASVLADGYLIAGSLTPNQAGFMFSWGALMQLLDDLQDVGQDIRSGGMTIFSMTARRGRLEWLSSRLLTPVRAWPLDAIANRTFHFAFRTMERLSVFDSAGLEPLVGMLRRAVLLSLVAGVGGSPRLFTAAYVRDLEGYLPVRFSFLDKQSRSTRQSARLMASVESFAAAIESSGLVE